jgi:2-polyprenyl-6-hydroxyphenyl methylase/3-demethylubiquinone-9 3-methyltransferase
MNDGTLGMGIGTFVRHRLGRLEIPAAKLYRSVFINLPKLAEHVAPLKPRRILEVGCGDGSFAQELLRVLPEATYLGIDIAPTAGRLFRGDPDRAEFRTMTVQDFHAERPQPFDLVALVDVVHHVPLAIREEVLRCSAELVAPGGVLIVKEFERNRGPYYYLTYGADRYVTGDRGVSFMTVPQLRTMVGGLDGFTEEAEWRVPPARNNILLTLRRQPVRQPAS